MSANPVVAVPPMCPLHQSLLVQQAGFTRDDPWRALIIMTQIALFQAATADPTTYGRIGGLVENLPQLGCLACYKPDAFGEIVQAVVDGGMDAIKPLGERWVREGAVRDE